MQSILYTRVSDSNIEFVMNIYLIFHLLFSVCIVFGYNCTSKDEDLAEGCALAPNFEKNDRFSINKTTNGDIFLTFYLKVRSHARVLLIEKPADSKSNENKVTIDITTNGLNISLPNGSEKYYQENYVVSPVEWREFWVRISTVHGWIKIGKGGNDTEFVSSNYPNAFQASYYSLSNFDGTFYIHRCLKHTVETMRNRIDEYNENTLKCAVYSASNHTAPPQELIRQHKMRMNFEKTIDEVLRYSFTYTNLYFNDDNMTTTWKDERLAWEPKQEYDRNSVKIKLDSIWSPEIEITNLSNKFETPFWHFDAIVSYDGTISWRVFVRYSYPLACLHSYRRRFGQSSAMTFQANVPFEFHFAQRREPRPPTNIDYDNWIITQDHITYKEPANASNAFWEAAFDFKFKNIQSEKEQWNIIKDMWYGCNKETPPKTPINLTCILEGKYSDLNNEKGIFELEGNARISWQDDRLQWDPVTFNNVTSISARVYDLKWQPQITMLNDSFLQIQEIIENYMYANVSSTGQVLYNKHLDMRTNCSNVNPGRWPWNMQKCRINFNTSDISQFTLHFIDKTDDYTDTTNWKIVKSEVVTSQEIISIEITLQIRSLSLQTELRSIYGVIAAITLLSFWLSPWNPWKTFVKTCSLLMLVFFFIFLTNVIPQFATIAFNCLIGYVTLIFIVGLSTYLSIRLVRLARKEHSPPPWRFVQDFVYHPIVRSVSCLWINLNFANQDVTGYASDTFESETFETSDDATPNDSKVVVNRKKKFFQNDWLKVAVILERSFFVVSFLIVLYLGMSLMS